MTQTNSSFGTQTSRSLGWPLEIRDRIGSVDGSLRTWIRERLGRQLGRFGSLVERVDVRFGDDNGPKGGVDRNCLVHVVLSALPPVAVEVHAETEREAFDRAAGRAARAVQHALHRHGFTNHRSAGKHRDRDVSARDGARDLDTVPDALAQDVVGDLDVLDTEGAQGMFGKREGRGHDRLLMLQARPEKERRDALVDTSLPGVSADARKVGYGHTAKRNTKLNTEGMSYALEDSTTGKPSRKSTRGSSNHSKPANGLTLRSKAVAHSPQAQAARGHSHR